MLKHAEVDMYSSVKHTNAAQNEAFTQSAVAEPKQQQQQQH